jgi:hypothetical protein
MGITLKEGRGNSPLLYYMKEKITQTFFIIIFIGSVFQGITTDSLYLLSFSLFTAGCS